MKKFMQSFPLVALVAALVLAGCNAGPTKPVLPRQESYLLPGSPAGNTFNVGDTIWITWSGEGLTTGAKINVMGGPATDVTIVNSDENGGNATVIAPASWAGKTLSVHYEVSDKFGAILTADGTAFWIRAGSAATGSGLTVEAPDDTGKPREVILGPLVTQDQPKIRTGRRQYRHRR